jgi:RHS repeat-associated protein
LVERSGKSFAYDGLGRLLHAINVHSTVRRAFDPASNLMERSEPASAEFAPTRPPAFLDNLLKDYAGTHFDYDERGNLVRRVVNGQAMKFGWNSFNRMVSASNARMQAIYMYDALGRRIAKVSDAVVPWNSNAGSGWAEMERKRLNAEFGYGFTLYGWDGDSLAYETSRDKRTTTHYVYEPDSFTPLMQAIGAMGLDDTAAAPAAFGSVAYYHCDQIGTPQELSDAAGEVAWSAHYKAWGEAKEVISEAAQRAGIRSPLRFAGQYFDHETGLHYNRHRYYDPHSGRFISKDPIGLAGGLNAF